LRFGERVHEVAELVLERRAGIRPAVAAFAHARVDDLEIDGVGDDEPALTMFGCSNASRWYTRYEPFVARSYAGPTGSVGLKLDAIWLPALTSTCLPRRATSAPARPALPR
jgi:hypothetical protein